MRSIRFSFRGRTRNERGYVLISAIVLAVLYFMLMELMLMESSHALNEAQRFRSRVLAITLAENAAELASCDIVNRTSASIDAADADGKMTATLMRAGTKYEINGEGAATGVQPVRATVQLQGRVVGTSVTIDYASHSQ